MHFLILSESGDSLSIAIRLKAEGNDVAMWVRDDKCQEVGLGLMDQVSDLRSIPERTITIADTVGFGPFCTMLKQAGYKVVGGALIADRLENDRAFSRRLMDKAGLRVPRSWTFESFEEAVAFATKHSNKRFALKPTGNLSGTFPSYISKGLEDLIEELEKFEDASRGEPNFELQEFIEGVAISLEGWFNGTKFIRPLNHTLERKHLANNELGPSMGCAGNVVWAKTDECDYLDDYAEILAEGGYVGPLDLNALITEDDGIYGLEFTPRFGYDAAPTLFTELFQGDLGQFFHDLAYGSIREMNLRSGYAFGIRITVLPWPYEEYKAEAGLSLQDVDLAHFAPYEVMLSQDGKYVTSGGHGIVGVACGYGETSPEAGTAAVKVAEQLKLRRKFYRTDLCPLFYEDMAKLGLVKSLQKAEV
jgi:phosphoribosylamine--glycine ligase